MNRVKSRTPAILIFALLIVIGLSVFTVRLYRNGQEWASFAANGNLYSGGKLKSGTILDRNGVVLATVSDGVRSYAEEEIIRKASLHVVGDTNGNIGTGALAQFSSELAGYDFVNGVYTPGGLGGIVILTVDSKLQEAAYRALDGRNGVVSVANYQTGEILCNVSTPTFDPVSPPELSEDDTSGVYINRFLSSAYTPGSTFKLVTLAAAIENIPDLFERTFVCNETLDVNGDTVTCTSWHGELTIEQALAVSCNCVFAELSLELGSDIIVQYASELGLTESMQISGISTSSGKVESAASGTADLAWLGIGQYRDLINPATMLRLQCAIANGGEAVALHYKTDDGEKKTEHLLSKNTADLLKSMMNYNVVYHYGEENYPGLQLCAKSGTAEVGPESEPHAWFVGFLMDPEHPYAFVVMVENGGYGSYTSGAIANTVLQAAVQEEK